MFRTSAAERSETRFIFSRLNPDYMLKTFFSKTHFNPLKTKHQLLHLKPQSVPRCKHFSSRYKNQSVYAVSGTSRCLFSDKYKTHKYSVGRAYSCWMLNYWCITWPVGFKSLILLIVSYDIDATKINPLKTKRRPLYLKTQSVPRSKNFSSRLQKPISLCCKWHKSLFVLR